VPRIDEIMATGLTFTEALHVMAEESAHPANERKTAEIVDLDLVRALKDANTWRWLE
jgi:uncharacterized protein YoaH (UPF0181 family)